MDDESLARDGASLVLTGWNRIARSATRLGGGINSATAMVDLIDERAVLKWVPDTSTAGLAAGCEVAQRLGRHGILTGEPFPTTAGDLTHPAENGAVALLRFIFGDVLIPNVGLNRGSVAGSA